MEKKSSILPPDYVSLAQLREKWLLKQQQQQQKELETKQNQETDETPLNGEKKKKKWNKKKKKKQPLVDQNQQACEIDEKNESVRVEIVPNKHKTLVYRVKQVDETKGNNGYNPWRNRKRFGGSMYGNDEIHVGASKGNEKSEALGEMGRNEVCLKVDCFVVEESDGLNGTKDEEKGEARSEFGGSRWWSEDDGRKIGRNRRWGKRKGVGGIRLERSGVESGKGDEKSKGLVEMSESGVLEVGVKLDGLKVNGGNGRKDDSAVGVGRNDEQIVGNVNRGKGGEKGGIGNEIGKNRNGSGNVGRTFGRPAFGNRRLGNKMTVGGDRSEKSVAELHVESSKGDEKGQDLDGMSKSGVLEVGVKLDGLKVNDFNANDDSVVEVGLNGDRIAENEKGELGNEFGKYRNGSGNVGRNFGSAGFVDRRRRNGNAFGNRNYIGSGRFGGGRMNQRDNNVKVWVKKEDKSGVNAA